MKILVYYDNNPMKLLSTLIFLMSFQIFASPAQLPLGGSISIDSKVWDAKTLDRNLQKMMVLIHKEHQDLQGYVLDGYPKTKETCKKTKSGKAWVVCGNITEVKDFKSVQYTLERKVGNSFQTYIISFNVPKDKYKPYLKELQKFSKELEAVK